MDPTTAKKIDDLLYEARDDADDAYQNWPPLDRRKSLTAPNRANAMHHAREAHRALGEAIAAYENATA